MREERSVSLGKLVDRLNCRTVSSGSDILVRVSSAAKTTMERGGNH